MNDNMLYKIIGIVLVLALVITIVTTNIVSITGLTLLKSGTGTVVTETQAETTAAPAGDTYDNTENVGADQTDSNGVVVTGTAANNVTTKSGGSSSGNKTTTTKSSSGNNTTTTKNSTVTDEKIILANYTTVVNKVKTDMPGYTSNDWQTLENISVGSTKYGLLSAAASQFLEKKEDSTEDTHDKGSYPKWFALPSTDATKAGCVLTDTNAIESASQKTNSDGTTTIVITLNKEKSPDSNIDDPSKCTSAHGRMFDTTSIAPVMEKVTEYGIDPDKCYCTYYGTATLVYDTKTMQCKSLDHVIDIRVFISTDQEAKIVADYHFYDFVW